MKKAAEDVGLDHITKHIRIPQVEYDPESYYQVLLLLFFFE